MECKKRIFQKEIIRIIYFKEISLSQTRIYLFFYNVFDSLVHTRFRQILKTSNIATELDSIPINAEMTFKVHIEWRISKGQ